MYPTKSTNLSPVCFIVSIFHTDMCVCNLHSRDGSQNKQNDASCLLCFFHELSVSIQHNMSVILTSAARYCSVARCLNLNKLFQWPAPPWQGSCWTTYKIVHENKWKNIWITVLLHIKSSVRMLIKDGTQLKCSQTISSFASIIASNKCLYNMKDFLTSNKKKISSFTLHTTVKQRFNVTKFFLFLLY